MSKKLEVRSSKDITISITGEGYISQKALERLLGLPNSSVKRRVIDKLRYIKVNKKNQLHEDSLIPAVEVFAKEGNIRAIKLLADIGKAGSRSYLYHQAGIPLGTSVTFTKVPTSYADALRLYADEVELKEKLLLTVDTQREVIDEDAISTNKSKEYFPISHVRKLNTSLSLSHHKLSSESVKLGYPVKQLFSNYDSVTTNTYAGAVWISLYPNIEL